MQTKAATFLLSFVAIFSISEGRVAVKDEVKPKRPLPSRVQRPTHLLKRLYADQCEYITRTDCLNKPLPRGKRVCAQIPEEEIRGRLQKIGGWNPLYTAMNETEAEHFKDPRWFFKGERPSKKLPDRKPKCKYAPKRRPPAKRPPKPEAAGKRKPNRTSDQPKESYGILNKKRFLQPIEKKQDKEASSDEQSEEMPDHEDSQSDQTITISKRSGEKTQSCWKRADVVKSTEHQGSYKRRHLCGECHVVTTLADDIRPRIINEASCNHLSTNSNKGNDGNRCAYQSGICIQRVLHFPALKYAGFELDNRLSYIYGTPIYVEKWIEFTKEIKAGCQCQMYDSIIALLKQIANP